MTARGRLLFVVALVALLFAAFTAGRAVSRASEPAGHGVIASTRGGTRPVASALTRTAPNWSTISAGDTLWSIARRLAPQRDPREVIDQIKRLNNLSTGALIAGQQLLLPAAV